MKQEYLYIITFLNYRSDTITQAFKLSANSYKEAYALGLQKEDPAGHCITTQRLIIPIELITYTPAGERLDFDSWYSDEEES